MARTDNHTWDLATSVGATATGVAVGGEFANRVDNPLINDPFAEPLVRAVGVTSSPAWPAVNWMRPRSTTAASSECSGWAT
jgi:O-methyltransferase involved in polyketide biosynthesis